ncbi:MAG: FtsX-like permease family protein [Planctomycetota bacterium]|nr:FtsX-like permease family protein [Planctomycetota bacterium]
MIRVAFKILLHDSAKFLALVLGIAFASLLISQQAAIFHSVMESSARDIIEASEADIWVMKPSVETIDQPDQMPELAVQRVRSADGVEWAVPYYQSVARLRTAGGVTKSVAVIGVDDASLVAAPRVMLIGSIEDLRQPDAVILDAAGFASIFPGVPQRVGDVVEIGERRARIVGISAIGPSWTGLPRVHARRSLATELARESANPVTFVLARAQPGRSADEVAAGIGVETKLKAFSRAGFKAVSQEWVLLYSGVAENFGITILMGVVIGVAIVGQTFYMFSVENLRQFAALKAIGVGNRRILAMISVQALFVSAIGFSLGIGVASLFFAVFSPQLTGGLRGMFMDPAIFAGTGIFVVVVTLLSCVVSARRVFTVDPAVVFRS